MDNRLLGERIKQLRLSKQMTQEELGKQIGESKETIYKWEKGLRNLKASDVKKISDFFNCTADYLIGRADNQNGVYYQYIDKEIGNIELEYPSGYVVTNKDIQLLIEELKKSGDDIET